MSEQPGRVEHQPQPSTPENTVEQSRPRELDPSHEIEAGKLPDRQEASQAVEAQAISAKEYSPGEQESAVTHTPGLHQELKTNSYEKTLGSVRRQLSAPNQVFSKIIHAKGVEPITNVAASTVGRPSGLLGGAIAALVASAYVLYMSKHYGFTYNYTTFVVFFVGGFLIGLLIELLLAPLRRRRTED